MTLKTNLSILLYLLIIGCGEVTKSKTLKEAPIQKATKIHKPKVQE